jgi:hypothetical protein
VLGFLEGWRHKFLKLELDDVYIWENISRNLKLYVKLGLTDRVRVTPVASTVFMYLTTSSTGSTGGLQDIKMTFVGRQDCAIRENASKFVPQGVFV